MFGRICKCYVSLYNLHPPTAQTDHHRDLKFGMDTHLRSNRGAIEAIFDNLTQSRVMGQGWGTPGGAKMSKIFFFDFFHFFDLVTYFSVFSTRIKHYLGIYFVCILDYAISNLTSHFSNFSRFLTNFEARKLGVKDRQSRTHQLPPDTRR